MISTSPQQEKAGKDFTLTSLQACLVSGKADLTTEPENFAALTVLVYEMCGYKDAGSRKETCYDCYEHKGDCFMRLQGTDRSYSSLEVPDITT